jgi:hypothetical protein
MARWKTKGEINVLEEGPFRMYLYMNWCMLGKWMWIIRLSVLNDLMMYSLYHMIFFYFVPFHFYPLSSLLLTATLIFILSSLSSNFRILQLPWMCVMCGLEIQRSLTNKKTNIILLKFRNFSIFEKQKVT